jgi:hypothetical protein
MKSLMRSLLKGNTSGGYLDLPLYFRLDIMWRLNRLETLGPNLEEGL